ncbi:MAG: M56 family metallopeptidase, partial [Bacillota bacterium]
MSASRWRPMVLLPIALLAGTPMEVLEAVIAHELAHIRRHDLWVNLLQRVLETLLFYHPAIWWLSGKVREERELCCDELAVKATGRRVEYAAALEQVASGKLAFGDAGLAAAWGTGRGMLLARVRHVLGLPLTRPAWGWPAGVAALVVLVLAGVGTHLARSAERANGSEGRAGDVPTLEEIAKALTEAEGKIANLQIQGFEMTQENLPAGAKAWQASPIRWAGTAWYDKPTGNRGRVNFDHHVLKWEGGWTPWLDSQEDVGFDGKTSRWVTHTVATVDAAGVADEFKDSRRARITKHNPLIDESMPYATGTAFNLLYTDYGEEKKLKYVPGWLRGMVRNGTKMNITRESVRGIAAVKLSLIPPARGGQFGLWLDPARGYALLKQEIVMPLDGQGVLFERKEITELAEAAPGIWYPVAASFEEAKGKNHQDRVRLTYRARKVIVNDPKFDPAVFTVPIPAGYQVADETKAESQIDKAFMYLGGTENASVVSTGEQG